MEKLVFLLSFSSFRSDIFHFFSFTNFFLSNKVKKIYYIQQLYCLKKLWFFREITSPVGSEYFSVVGLDRHLRVYKIKGKWNFLFLLPPPTPYYPLPSLLLPSRPVVSLPLPSRPHKRHLRKSSEFNTVYDKKRPYLPHCNKGTDKYWTGYSLNREKNIIFFRTKTGLHHLPKVQTDRGSDGLKLWPRGHCRG